MQGERIRIRGLVQGVGFRPTVWRLANAAGLRGAVINDGEGVLVTAWGSAEALDRFCVRLRAECPPLGRIDVLEREPADGPPPGDTGFEIQASQATRVQTGIVADAATCAACLTEVFDPTDRRYRYPFTNCTHCGPRLSIVKAIPYDRANTSMAAFPQCPQCQAEYHNPADRRFHAQPNACPRCGPRAWLEDASGSIQDPQTRGAQDAIALTAALLAAGHVVAIKGIGGFHLACDAGNADAVAALRRRKQRDDKPFALMAANIRDIERFVQTDDAGRALLQDSAAPVLLAERSCAEPRLAPAVAPGQPTLGFMLPYSPLHHLLLADWQAHRPGCPLVMTSGNRSDEPQCTDNADARQRLQGIADYWLMHDRDIVNRVDDSVVRVDTGIPRLIRRARGLAPSPVMLPPGFADAPPLTALGAELKSTLCLLRDGQATLSQHLGDLEDARTSDAWEQTLALYQRLFQHQPTAIAVDLHPDYRSTRFGRDWARQEGIDLIAVQHHHAHIAAVMADNNWALDAGPVIGIALDGLGLGTDGTLWGGELLRAEYHEFKRIAHLQAVPLPGGTAALREPWRNTWAHLFSAFGWQQAATRWPALELTAWLQRKPVQALEQMVMQGLNSPLSSSCGRLFDAVAAALDIHRGHISYEGQAAIELEHAARRAPGEHGAYPLPMHNGVIEVDRMWATLLDDLHAGVGRECVAARFHNGLAAALTSAAAELCERSGIDTVALSGGVLQNRILFTALQRGLTGRGLRVLSHSRVPSNDGGIALGQAVVAAARLLRAAPGRGVPYNTGASQTAGS